MIRSISNMPIFRRLFFAFVLAAVIPGIIIAALGTTYINLLTARGQAVQNSSEALKVAGDGLTDIEAGNAAGCQTIFIGRWKCEYEQFIHPPDLRPSFVAKDLWGAAKLIESRWREAMAVNASAAMQSYTELAYR